MSITVTSIVQAWVNGALTNNGVLLHGTGGNDMIKFFRSNNYGTEGGRPKLEVDYVTNQRSVAIIDSIDPSPAREMTEITFTGHGTDEEDGDATSGFRWTAKSGANPAIVLGTAATITADNLTAGTYTIGFSVLDSEGAWSYEETQSLTVTPDEPPADIEDLKAEPHGSVDGAINLTWTAVAEDGEDEQGKAASYIIKYSDGMIYSEASFELAKDPANKNNIPNPGDPEEEEIFTVLGLTSSEEYFFGIIVVDEKGQRGSLSNIAQAYAPDHTRPGRINDLEAKSGEKDGEVGLEWTAPGEDGNNGKVISYTIRYSEEKIADMVDYNAADVIPNEDRIPLPDYPGFSECMTVRGLSGGTTYYFAISAVDEVGNWGLMSNIAIGMAKDLIAPIPINGVYAEDTPDDQGQSLDVKWDKSHAHDFDHYNIYISSSDFSNIAWSTPVKSIDNIEVTQTTVVNAGTTTLTDWKDYYVAVTAADVYDNEYPDVECFGPARSVNNLARPQPLLNPEIGETYSMMKLEPNLLVNLTLTKVTVLFEFTERDLHRVDINYSYSVKGTAFTFFGDVVDRIDIYTALRYKSSDWLWGPLLEINKMDDYSDVEALDTDEIDEYYEAFRHLILAEEKFSLQSYGYTREYIRTVSNDSLDEMMLEGKDIEFKICVVAWTNTYQWNYISEQYDITLDFHWTVDEDGDNVPDGWEKMFFGSAGIYGAKDDPDRDGFTNGKEYEMRTDPNDPEAHPPGKMDVVSDKGALFSLWLIIIVVIILLFVFGSIFILIVKLKRPKKEKRKKRIYSADEFHSEEISPQLSVKLPPEKQSPGTSIPYKYTATLQSEPEPSTHTNEYPEDPILFKVIDSVQCTICLGYIKRGASAFRCICQKVYHPVCAGRTGKCPICQRNITKEEVGLVEPECSSEGDPEEASEEQSTNISPQSDQSILGASDEFNISDVFLISLDGLLIYSLSFGTSVREETDEDIMTGMLTPVSDFIRDSFQTELGGLKTLQNGRMTLFLERGTTFYLVVVFRGESLEDLRGNMRDALIQIWDRYKGHLKDWNGTHDGLEGIDDLLIETLGFPQNDADETETQNDDYELPKYTGDILTSEPDEGEMPRVATTADVTTAKGCYHLYNILLAKKGSEIRIGPLSPKSDISKARKQIIRMYHPDRWQSDEDKATFFMQKVNVAWDVLSNIDNVISHCPNCEKEVQPNWAGCPYCAYEFR